MMRISAKTWIGSGLVWAISLPLCLYLLAFVIDFASIVRVDEGGRAAASGFPVQATLYAQVAMFSTLTAVVALAKAFNALAPDRLRHLDESMRNEHPRAAFHSGWYPVGVLCMVAVCYALIVFGPFDSSVLDALGLVVSRDPVVFAITQSALVFLIYALNGVLVAWINVYAKITKRGKRGA